MLKMVSEIIMRWVPENRQSSDSLVRRSVFKIEFVLTCLCVGERAIPRGKVVARRNDIIMLPSFVNHVNRSCSLCL